MRYEVDFLVVGSGIAGLSFALKVAQYGKVCILSKSDAAEGSTRYAQGGIAAVMYDDDSFDKHIQDTLVAGDGICDRDVVEMTIREAPERITELVQYGVNFDMEKKSGRFDLHREGGHSEFRILHHKDNTGEEIERGLLQAIHNHPNIELKEHQFAIDIITQHHLGQRVTKHTPDIECYGVYALDTETNRIDTYLAKVTLLATGGMGNVYSTTTTPIISTGDGVAMVHRARGVLKDLEFMQFHPTSLYNPAEKPAFLITEAMRGAGAILKDRNGNEFMQKYDKRMSLAPRDIVARAIDNEMKLSGKDYLYLDARGIGKKHLIEGFPTIYAKCLSIGIDITRDMIPIRPAAHYQCGGIKVDRNGESSIHHLYAAGECSCTGLHGGNRLASNSLLEAVVYAHNAAQSAIKLVSSSNLKVKNEVPDWNAEGMVFNEEMVLITQTKKELQEIMTNYVGIVRSDLRLRRAFDRLNLIFRETEELYNRSVLTEPLCELRNLIACAYLIIKQAMARRQNVGLHYSIDLTRENGDAHEDVGVPARAENESASSKEQTIKVNSFSDAELDDAMRLMASNRGKDDQPKVGIFWYDTRHKELFGIRSHLVTDYLKPNSRSEFGSVSCSEMHEDVWKKEFNKQRYKNGGIGPFVGPYEMTPRGRIFYNPSTDEYTIAVGSWINEHPEAVQLIVDEFNLGNTKYSVKAAQHWDVGQKWM